MIQPAPTSRIDPKLARGIYAGVVPATATRPQGVKLTFPNTSYELHLVASSAVNTPPGKRVVGTIRARAKRMDVVKSGGRFIEPVFGRPRRVQGTVIAIDGGAVVVDAGVPIHCELTDPRQKPGDFAPGDFVGFDVLDGATFTPA